MICSLLSNWHQMLGLFSHPIWNSAFKWLELNATNTAEGEFHFGQGGVLARVMKYPLLERNNACYENHRHTVDVQYTVDGAEGIEVCDCNTLESLKDYSPEKDVEHFKTPDHCHAWVRNSKGHFVILFPNEPHMPKLKVNGADLVHKVVIKIPITFFARNQLNHE